MSKIVPKSVKYLKTVPELPPARPGNSGKWVDLLNGFSGRSDKCMTVEFERRYEMQSAMANIKASIKRANLKMRVQCIENTLYVVKEEMEDGDEAETG